MQILISIHALLAESDTVTARIIDPTYDFYPRSPCGERLGSVAVVSRTWNFYPRSPCGERPATTTSIFARLGFLSTLSLRRATRGPRHHRQRARYFYPRSPCGERRNESSEHTDNGRFLSTLSLRRATAKVHKTVGHFCAYETNFMGIASSC